MPTHLIEVCQGLVFSHQHLGELCPLFWVHPHHISEQEDVVWCVADLLGVENDLLELPSLSKALNNLHMST